MKKVLVVGAARGIGAALSDIISENNGFMVIKVSRTYAELAQVSQSSWHIGCDVNNQDEIANLVEQLKDNFETIDWIINCVGILHTDAFMPEKSLQAVNLNQLYSCYQTNAISHILLLKALTKLIDKKKPASITSISARIGSIEDNHLGGWYAYRMSKAALNMGIKTLAIEWSRKLPLVKFLLLHPGTTDTDLSAPFQKNLPEGQLQTSRQTAQLLWQQIQTHHDHSNKLPLFLDQHGLTIPW